ncbi:MAG: hypothetical protein K9M82_07890 [Deltaproteobacteria bacterium]|nr:hypothetical protein [Deltaproteobacteria bacterium]
MEQPKPAPGAGTHSMLDVLDQAFVRHLERITGTREGIHGLSMDLVTVACIVLMAEHAGDANASHEAIALDRADLEGELSEMGLDDPERLEITLEEMVRKGYMELDACERLLPGKPSLSMARLLDHAFPGMPGVNLVAYFVQTLDEVESGRKQAKKALLQLDQMLRHHGAAPFGKSKKERETGPAPSGHPRMQRPTRLKAPTLRPGSIPRQERTAETGPSPNDSPIRESEGVREAPAEPDRPERESLGVVQAPGETPDDRDDVETPDEEVVAEPPPVSMEPLPREPDSAPASEVSEAALIEEPVREEPALEAPAPEQDGEVDLAPSGGHEVAPDPEERVEGRISAFEEELAMQCPVCRKASVEIQKTAKGRVYYKCADEECMFISWGRPHHIPCPLCGNPFLVEMDSGGDRNPLKCPRATCRYRETSPGEASADKAAESGGGATAPKGRKPRKRVVRRKVRKRRR